MSDYESHRGTLTLTEHNTPEKIEEYFKSICPSTELPKYYENYTEWGIEEETYFIIEGVLYTIQDNAYDDSDVFDMKENEDGSFDYYVRFYNGGCGFGEALDTAAEKLKKDKK